MRGPQILFNFSVNDTTVVCGFQYASTAVAVKCKLVHCPGCPKQQWVFGAFVISLRLFRVFCQASGPPLAHSTGMIL